MILLQIKDIDFLMRFRQNLEEACKGHNIEFVLKKYGLLRAETLDLLSTPQNLIEHIYASEIDWNNCKEISMLIFLLFSICIFQLTL